MTEHRCPECGVLLSPGYNEGDACDECHYLTELARDLSEETGVDKIKARLREEYHS